MELQEALRKRRMVRAYERRPVDAESLDRVLAAARRAPSAGNSQTVDLLVLEEEVDRGRFWDLSFPIPESRATFTFQGMFDAPVVIVPLIEPEAYARRYSLPDKARTGLDRLEAWPAPYWWIDGGAAVMNMLLVAVDEGLGALFFGLFVHESEILRAFGVPDGYRALGAITLGHPVPDTPGVSSGRPRRSLDEIAHRGGWQPRAGS